MPDLAARLRAAIDGHDDIVLLIDRDGGIAYANQRAAETYGYTTDRLASMALFDLDTELAPEFWPKHWESLKRQGMLQVTVRHATRGGNMVPLEINDTYIELDGVEYSCIIARYASHRDAATRQMLLMQFSINQMHESVYWIGPDATIEYANDAACYNLGYSADELIGMSVVEFDPNFTLEIWSLHWAELRERHHITFETLHQHQDGHVFPVEVSANYLKVGEHEYNCAFSRDITERKLAEGKLQQMATRDALTGLPNPTLLHDRIDQAIARSKRSDHRLAVLFIDIDRFSEINTQYGRDVGDQTMQAIAHRLGTPLRTVDTLSRWSSDTFVVLVDDISSAEDARAIARKLLDTLHAPLSVGELAVTVSASIGIACYPEDGEDTQTLCKNADIAIFRATEIGDDTIQLFSQAAQVNGESDVILLMELRQALRNDEMVILYQPEIALASGWPVALVAQLHWQHPRRGLLPPAAFMGVAEENGYTIELGHWLFEHACRQLRAWRDRDMETPPLAISLTLRQLRDGGLVETLEGALTRHGLSPEGLCLGLPSPLLTGHQEQTAPILDRLQALGVTMAVDGFGTVPTLHRMLLSLPIKAVRLDCDAACGSDRCLGTGDGTLVQGLISLCHALDLKVTMVGVDSAERLACATRYGCDATLGSHTVPAMDAEATADWLAAHAGA